MLNRNKERANLNYINATKVLPKELLAEVQKYIQGETLYIPIQQTTRKKWGSVSGIQKQLNHRNQNIRENFDNGMNIQEISENYFLSVETIKKIVYTKKEIK